MTKVKLLVMDVDGTLTDGKSYISPSGELLKAFDIKDGCGIHDLLPEANIVPIVITARESRIVECRCKELGITHVYQGCRDKVKMLCEIAEQFDLAQDENGVYSDIAYIGDDLIDLPCMHRCRVAGCPSDAAERVKEEAQFISSRKGGEGAVREFIEWLISTNQESKA